MKYVLLEIVLFFIMYVLINNSLVDDELYPVFQMDDSSSEYNYVTLNCNGLTTKNFYQYFIDGSYIEVLYPTINPFYKNRLGEVKYYCNKSCKLENFEKYYQNILREHSFFKDSISIDYYGVSISKVIVHVNEKELFHLLKKCTICSAET